MQLDKMPQNYVITLIVINTDVIMIMLYYYIMFYYYMMLYYYYYVATGLYNFSYVPGLVSFQSKKCNNHSLVNS